MADNASATAGDGSVIVGTDKIGGVDYQRIKANWGPDGTINDTDVASGMSFPVQVRSATGLIPVGEPTDAANTSTDTTSVSLISVNKQISSSIQSLAASGAAIKTIAMTTDTSPYASGDLVADTQQLDAAFRKTNGTGVLNTLTIIDQDAQGVALYVMFHYSTTSMGTENNAPSISDANLIAGLQGIVAVATTDYVTISGSKVACIRNIGLPLKSVSGTDDLYISIVNGTGTPTFTATGLYLTLGILQD
jgi:hypothetical protein